MTTLSIEPVVSLLSVDETMAFPAVTEPMTAELPSLPDLFAETFQRSAALDESIAQIRRQIVRTFQVPVVEAHDQAEATRIADSITANGAYPFHLPQYSPFPSSSQPQMTSQVVVDVAKSIADAVYVTPGLLQEQGTVTIRLKADVLGGAQVTVSVVGMQIEVGFEAVSAPVAALIERNLPQIQHYLGLHIQSHAVAVKINKTRG